MILFKSKDQLLFASLSGDYNPAHLDRNYARRLVWGGEVVHGIHQVLFGIEQWLDHKDRNYCFKNFKVKYSHGDFVFLYERIKNIDLPLINFNTEFKNKEIEKIYNKIMKKEGIGKIDFLIREIPELVTEGVSRKAFVSVDWDSMNFDKEKREAIVRFYLHKGSYATIVLKKAVNRKSF